MRKPANSPHAQILEDEEAAVVKQTRLLALSTGRAARFCYVTSETILNWIRSGELKAQRTAGGQYRIRIEDLREFMARNGMDTSLLEQEARIRRPYCWEFHCAIGTPAASAAPRICEDCLVRRAGTLNCWELHPLLPLTARRVLHCHECEYHRRFHDLALEPA
jgi:excisionase family DNA binding protein